MRDDADEGTQYDDYRVVVDLEWSTYRVKDYGNKKSWVLVYELISPYHDVVIAEAVEDKSCIREAYIINNEASSNASKLSQLASRHALLRLAPLARPWRWN